jgi:hypothetical protein
MILRAVRSRESCSASNRLRSARDNRRSALLRTVTDFGIGIEMALGKAALR